MIKLIASDMDGTLINDEGKINEKMFGLINDLHEKNIKFAAASGRFYSQLSKNFKKIRTSIIFISHNGALVKYNNKGETLYSSCISIENIEHVASLKRDFGEELFLGAAEDAYIVDPSQTILEEFKFVEVPSVIVKTFKEVKCPIYRMTYYIKDGVRQETIEYLKDNLNENLEFVVSGDKWIDIMNKGTSKGSAIKILQEKFDINENNTMVFGDYYNDLSMFKEAYYSYAMENAPEDVKKHANFIAENNNKNGVYNVINKYAASI
ncbi:Cof-type HAD-IIB family hydrolase [Clostridium sp. JS66]|uniref:Cof-type HAD-IIB family hydrolase n=1 Tax=Clostridium sp. JS66 TaxID=3064705 RepID=UPI00298E0CF6|nr:Cof-type HAD-IIB family hydrolase [Clostridium sp. JS66]WPC40495.1 Cof-type HAD-IIB family hydrolase [Clostridium sp. JS66]